MAELTPTQRLLVVRALRSTLLMVLLTAGALYVLDGGAGVVRPRGNPLLHATAISWLIAIMVLAPAGAIFKANPGLLPLARWEDNAHVYGDAGVSVFRWVLVHSPLGWINPTLHVAAGRADLDRVLRDLRGAEGVHWATCVLATILAVAYLVHGHAAYGYALLLVRIPFDVYPVMLQRRNQGRVSRLLRRQPRRSR